MWDKLPPQARRIIIDSKLTPGRLLHLFCDFTTPQKEKFLALVCINPEPRFFIINSEINTFVRKRPYLEKCQVRIDAKSHPFLAHDSFIDCTEVHPIAIAEIHRQIGADFNRIKTVLSPAVIANVIAAVKFARTLSPEEQSAILAALKV